jgi:hypothetical protein
MFMLYDAVLMTFGEFVWFFVSLTCAGRLYLLAPFQILNECRQASFRDLITFEDEGEGTIS